METLTDLILKDREHHAAALELERAMGNDRFGNTVVNLMRPFPALAERHISVEYDEWSKRHIAVLADGEDAFRFVVGTNDRDGANNLRLLTTWAGREYYSRPITRLADLINYDCPEGIDWARLYTYPGSVSNRDMLPGNYFVVNGEQIASLHWLEDSLNSIGHNYFGYHVAARVDGTLVVRCEIPMSPAELLRVDFARHGKISIDEIFHPTTKVMVGVGDTISLTEVH